MVTLFTGDPRGSGRVESGLGGEGSPEPSRGETTAVYQPTISAHHEADK